MHGFFVAILLIIHNCTNTIGCIQNLSDSFGKGSVLQICGVAPAGAADQSPSILYGYPLRPDILVACTMLSRFVNEVTDNL